MNKHTRLIGITGNIATGKSVVRRMLANLGALELDADVLGHRAIYPQGAAFKKVAEAFGDEILTDTGEISRQGLGKIVFQDPERLAVLESIVHPAVTEAVQKRLAQASTPFAALEAIKLFESGLDKACDAVWVCHASHWHQVKRLHDIRHMTVRETNTRLRAQPPQEEKLAKADAVIHTDSTFEHTWLGVAAALNDTIQESTPPQAIGQGLTWLSLRDLPQEMLLDFWEAHSGEPPNALFEALGMRQVQALAKDGQLEALLLWENWNFTAALTRILPAAWFTQNQEVVLEAFREAAQRQGCELLLLPEGLEAMVNLDPADHGYELFHPEAFTYPAWRIAAEKVKAEDQACVWVYVLAAPLEAQGDFQLQ